ncbi:helix-turn-helix domain-containing protein [Streptomyces sp. NBC_00425]|uniref:helix-turn-helix domain-containing protein n=1 Tax=Streptomyces sp. NBC_00425 TaxID=2975740 RepID=UPI002E213DAB
MRSKGSLGRPDDAGAFGTLVASLAVQAGYDIAPYGTGRRKLTDQTGMSASAVSRMLRGETLPKPENIIALARALKVDERRLLDAAGIPLSGRTKQTDAAVVSFPQSPAPEAIADFLGITLPHVRRMLTSSIEQALRLQREADSVQDGDDGGAAVGT